MRIMYILTEPTGVKGTACAVGLEGTLNALQVRVVLFDYTRLCMYTRTNAVFIMCI